MPAWVRCVHGCFKRVWAREAVRRGDLYFCPHCAVELPRGIDPYLVVKQGGG